MKKIFTAILLTGLSFGTAFPQSVNKSKLDSLFNILAEKNKAMGSLTISKNGTVLYTKAIGYSFISDNEKKPSTNITKYRIGSVSKMFTATMIFQLIDEGKIKLNTTLDTFFPHLPNAKKITIGNLLNHRSGLHNITEHPDYMTWMTQPKTQAEMLAIISKDTVDFQPDEKTYYSNTNYIVLGYIIEKISNRAYSEELNKRITSKIELSDTYFGSKTNVKNNESYSYNYKYKWEQQPETDMSVPGGAGGIVSTPTDLTKFIEALFSLKLVSQNSLAQMKIITEGEGMGMEPIPFDSRKGFGFEGTIDGFVSNLAYYQEDSLAVAYCTNGQIYPWPEIWAGVLNIYFGKDYSIPSLNTLSLRAEDLDKYLGIYSNNQIPLKLTISKENLTLIAQAAGQDSFPLEATAEGEFKYYQAGIVLKFNKEKNELTLEQGGGSYLFTKDK
ncbi:MAG: serine hydrolase domain-containing protein [Bacteroidales bacterium]